MLHRFCLGWFQLILSLGTSLWDFGNQQEACGASLHFRAAALVGTGMFLKTLKE